MSRPRRIEGYAIVSSNGMIADSRGRFPPALKFEADQRFFEHGLDNVDVIAHGRHSRERHARSAQRRRLILTRRVPALAGDPARELALYWNPAGASFEAAWSRIGLRDASLAVIGGTEVFGLFLDAYDLFHLTRAEEVFVPGGRPVFPGIPARLPEAILAKQGMEPGASLQLGPDRELTVTTWRRNRY
jgi:dihydrofolate reductase